jgi:hypothetical protein
MTKRSVALVGILILMAMVGSTVIGLFTGRASGLDEPVQNGSNSVFLPLVMKFLAQLPGGDSGVLYVFHTTAQTDGDAGGRVGMNDLCIAEYSDSHFCSIMEIENAMATSGVRFSTTTTSWIDSAKLGSLNLSYSGDPLESNWTMYSCTGWTGNSSQADGAIIHPTAEEVRISDCSSTRPVICCKRLP